MQKFIALFASICKLVNLPRFDFQALLHSVPIGKMIVLDLFADVKPIWKMSSQFYGVPYIWYVFFIPTFPSCNSKPSFFVLISILTILMEFPFPLPYL